MLVLQWIMFVTFITGTGLIPVIVIDALFRHDDPELYMEY